MIEIDVKINGVVFDRIHVANVDKLQLGLTTYKVDTLHGKGFTVQHTKEKGLYELLSRVFRHGNLMTSAELRTKNADKLIV